MKQNQNIKVIALAGAGLAIVILALWLAVAPTPPQAIQPTPQAKAQATATPRPTVTVTPTTVGFVAVGGGAVATPTPLDEQPTADTPTLPGVTSPTAPPVEQTNADTPTNSASPTAAPPATPSPQVQRIGSASAPTPIPFVGGEAGGSWRVNGDSTTYQPPAGGQAGDALGLIAQLPNTANNAPPSATIAANITSKYGEDCGLAVGAAQAFTLVRLRGAKTATYVRFDNWQGEGNFTPLGDDVRVDSAYISTPHQLLISLADTMKVQIDGADVSTAPLPAGSDVLLYAGGEGCLFQNVTVATR